MEMLSEIGPQEAAFIAAQHMFFVATAPLADDGHVNCSPKGLSSFAQITPNRVAYLDLGGSGIETHAHLRENGRICLMFCAFEGSPLILRLYGEGTPHQFGTPQFDAMRDLFPDIDVPVRGIIEVNVARVQRSCGWAVPKFDFLEHRDRLLKHNAGRSQDEFMARRIETNSKSIDGLPGLEG
jgi:hypothetical protein